MAATGRPVPLNGPGNWNTSTTNWWTTSATAWSDGSDAVFGAGGTAGTVTITATTPVAPNSITFNPTAAGNYTITGGSISLNYNSLGYLPVTVNQNATISSQFTGTGGLQVSGSRSLTLAAAQSYSGSTNISGGTLVAGVNTPAIVTQWNNLATNANAGTSATFNTAAIYTGNFVNSAPTYSFGQVNFSGSQGLAIPVSAGQFASGYTVFVVAQATGALPSGYTALVSRNSYDSPYGSPWDMFNNDVVTGAITGGVTGQNISAMTTQSVLELTGIYGGSVTEYVNGVQKLTYTPSKSNYVDTGTEIYLGTRGDGYTSFVGNMEDVLVYSGTLTSAQNSAVLSDLQTAAATNAVPSLPATTATLLVELSAASGVVTSGGPSANLSSTSPVSISGGATLDLNAISQAIPSLSSADSTTRVALGGGVLTVGSGNATTTFAGVISDSGGASPLTGGGLIVTGTGAITLTGANSYSGVTTINGGTLQIGGAGVLSSGAGSPGNYAAGISISSSGALVVNTSSNQTFSGTISGAGALTQAGSGTLTLTQANTYSGPTTVSGGTLAAYGYLYTSSLTVAGGATFNAEGTNVIYNGATFAPWFVNGTVYAGANVNENFGNLTLGGGTLSGSASPGLGYGNYGNYTVAVASYAITSSGRLADQRAPGGMSLQGSTSLGIDVVNLGDVLTISASIFEGPGSSAGITKTGGGMLVLSGSNTYSGNTNVNAGVLSLANSAALAGGGNITFGGGTLQFTASNTQDYSTRIVNSTGAIALDTNGQNVAFNSPLASSNSGGLTKFVRAR